MIFTMPWIDQSKKRKKSIEEVQESSRSKCFSLSTRGRGWKFSRIISWILCLERIYLRSAQSGLYNVEVSRIHCTITPYIFYHIVSLFEIDRNVSTFWPASIISSFHQPLMSFCLYEPSSPWSLGCPFLPSAPYQAKNMLVPVEPNERIAALRRDHKRPAAHLKSCQRHKDKLQNMRKARSSSNQRKICSRILRVGHDAGVRNLD